MKNERFKPALILSSFALLLLCGLQGAAYAQGTPPPPPIVPIVNIGDYTAGVEGAMGAIIGPIMTLALKIILPLVGIGMLVKVISMVRKGV